MKFGIKKQALFSFLLVFLFLAACQKNSETQSDQKDRMVVFVSVVPQQYFVDRIGGELVDTRAMVEPGASPATYEPKPSQMAALSDAELYFSIGVAFEQVWLDKISSANADMLIIDSAKGIERLVMTDSHEHEDEDGHVEAEDVGELDPHIWLSPSLVKVQAQNIYEALAIADPENAMIYEENLNQFLSDITILQNELTETLANAANRKFMVFHPSWGYFAEDFNLEQLAIEVGGTEPSASELADLISEAQEENIAVVFAQPEFSTKDAETIASAIDGEVILVSPLAYDWLENLREVAGSFSSAMSK